MSVLARALPAAEEPASPRPGRAAARVRLLGLIAGGGLLVVVALLSVWFGTRGLGLGTVWTVLWHPDGSTASAIIHDHRMPRTVLGIVVGVSLGASGALMQALTRNPLADPGLLGVSLGAATGVVVGIAFLGVVTVLGYVWFAFAGAAVASAVVYVLGLTGRGMATPDRLVLAGAALTAVLAAFSTAVLLLFPRAFDDFRFWTVGSLAGRDYSVVLAVAPFVVVGVLIALALPRSLNALALGDELGRALGAHVVRTRVFGALAVTLLCGAATAAVGPLWFVGLAVPHLARLLVGPDQRWVVPYSMVLAPVLLLGSDILGRLLGAPGELQVGIVTAFLGAPVFIALCRRRKLASL